MKLLSGLSLALALIGSLSGLSATQVVASPVSDSRAAQPVSEHGVRFSGPDEQGRYRFLVRFEGPGALQRYGAMRGTTEGFRIDEPAAINAIEQVRMAQNAYLQQLDRALGREIERSHRYLASHNGAALRLTPAEAQTLRQMDGVVSVTRERVYQPDTYRGPEFIGAGSIWDGSATPDGSPLRGEDMVAAVLDTGVVPTHPSFANDPACGHGESGTPDKLLSVLDCSSVDDVTGLCNGPVPEDVNSHGSHVAATVAGNVLDDSADPPPDLPGTFTQLSGVAPCAHIRSYKVCPDGCPSADIQAGMESVLLHDDVDVMNFSISGGTDPWNDNDRTKLDLVDAGVFVAASAGNSGPDPSTVAHRGPWVASVAASTRDTDSSGGDSQGDVLAGFSSRGPTPAPLQNLQKPDLGAPGVGIYAAASRLEMSVSGPGSPPSTLQGIRIILGSASLLGSELIDHPIAFDPDQPDGSDGCDPGFPADFFNGSVALIQRGGCTFTEKINNAAAAGADMVVIWNHEAGDFRMDTSGQDPATPAVSMSQANGQNLHDFIVDHPDATVAYAGEPLSGYAFISGTSMASPHLAGAALLVRQARPGWTPSEVKSALQMSAFTDGFKEDGTTPWDWDDVGSGRVDLTEAALAGLVMDEIFDNYLDADPDLGGDVRTLNLPALRNIECGSQCSFTRTVRNTLDEASNWEVSGQGFDGAFSVEVTPASFTFGGGSGETQELTITITPDSNQMDSLAFGEIVLSETGAQSSDLHWTVAVALLPPVANITPGFLEFALPEDGTGSQALTIANDGDVDDGADLSFNIGEASGAQKVVLDHQSPDGSPTEPIELIVDNGSAAFVMSPELDTSFSFVWLNQFTPQGIDLPFVLEQVQVLFAEGNGGVAEGDVFDLYIWSAPGGDPTGETVLLGSMTGNTVQGFGFHAVAVPDGGIDVDAGTGDVLIGVVYREEDPREPAVMDSGPSLERSWVAYEFPEGDPGDPPDFDQAGTFELAAPDLNFMVRGFGTGGSPCLEPGDVDWLSVTPGSGEVAPGQSETVDVSVDMSGLGGGTFEALVCIETNDPAVSTAVVPVTVEVAADAVFHDRFEAGPGG